jgi:hypothetical protein
MRRSVQIYYKSLSEVQRTPNIIKITLRCLDHRITTTAIKTSRRRIAAAAPPLSWSDFVDYSPEVCLNVPIRTNTLEPQLSHR